MRDDAKFLTGSTMRHVVEMTVTGMMGLMFMFLVDVAALFWVSYLGDERLIAAIGFAWPIQLGSLAVAMGLMIATTAIVSRALGQRDVARARRLATASVLITFCVQACIALLTVIFAGRLLALSGAEGETAVLAERFLIIVAFSQPLVAVSMCAAAVLRSLGDAWRAMLVTFIAGLVAMVLDPLVIVYLGLGTDGAALVIMASRVVAACVAFYCVIRVHDMLAPPQWGTVRRHALPFAAIAVPSVATQMSLPVGNYILTSEISAFGESAVAGWAVVSRVSVFAFGGIFALSSAIGGIFGQNYGAGQTRRLVTTYRDSLIFCTGYILVVWALMAALAGPLSDAFGLSAAGREVAFSFFRIAAGGFAFVGALYVANSAFNSLDRPVWSTAFNWLRDGLLTWGFAGLLAAHLGAPGVVYAQALAGILAGTLGYWAGYLYIRQLDRTGIVPA